MPVSTAAPASLRLCSTYHDGPLTWAVATELPEEASDSLIPGFGSFLQYDIAGGHQIIIAGATGWQHRYSPARFRRSRGV